MTSSRVSGSAAKRDDVEEYDETDRTIAYTDVIGKQVAVRLNSGIDYKGE